jgi:hypothetical protein
MTELARTYIERFVTGSWANISSYVVGDIEIEYLISPDEDVKIASAGHLQMTMNNSSGNFSPNRYFQRGTKIRVRTVYDGVSKTRFIGTIKKVDPDTLEWGDQYVRVDCVDWMQFAIDYPSIVLELQEDIRANEAVAYLLSLMSIQPESVTYYEGRETFDFTFDNARKASQIYTEMSRLALSEFAPIYLRAGNVLVVESATTRNGTRELTDFPAGADHLHSILSDPNGGLQIRDEQTNFVVLADERVVPNFASGTFQPIDIEIENGDALTNRVVAKSYPTREDNSPVLLFKLDVNLTIGTYGTYTLRGNYADPNGGAPISAKNFVTMVTGTHYIFKNKDGTVDQSTQIQIIPNYGSQYFEHRIINRGKMGKFTKFQIYGIGVYPYNPVSSPAMVTGSVNSYSISETTIDQRYQNDVNAGVRIAEMITDDEKEPRNRALSVTFDASLSPELMQASQYMDSGDLTWVKNVKPAVDTYAYIRGKKSIISPAGLITETWYLSEMDSLRNGLRMVALKFSGLSNSKNVVDFGAYNSHNVTGSHTWMCRFWMQDGPSQAALISKTDVDASFNVPNDIFMDGINQTLSFDRAFSINDNYATGRWDMPSGTLSGLQNAWHHVAVTYDDLADSTPKMYLDGTSRELTTVNRPTGTALDYSDAPLMIGNLNVVGAQVPYNFNGYIKDVRIYSRELSRDEIVLIASNHRDYLSVPDGMVFQAPCVKSEDYSGITGTVLYPTNKLIDNVFGVRGTPSWNFASGTSSYYGATYALKAYNPDF